MGASTAGMLSRLGAGLEPVQAAWPDGAAARGDAAVLLLLDPARPGLPLLFIRRSRQVRTHRGQVAFPGGGAEPADAGPAGTALREAREELGIDAGDVEVIGQLNTVATANTGRRLVPVVAVQRRSTAPSPDGYEVAAWFSVPLTDLLDAPVTSRSIPGRSDGVAVHFYEVGTRVIWGATAAVLRDLLERLRDAGAAAAPGSRGLTGSADAPRRD